MGNSRSCRALPCSHHRGGKQPDTSDENASPPVKSRVAKKSRSGKFGQQIVIRRERDELFRDTFFELFGTVSNNFNNMKQEYIKRRNVEFHLSLAFTKSFLTLFGDLFMKDHLIKCFIVIMHVSSWHLSRGCLAYHPVPRSHNGFYVISSRCILLCMNISFERNLCLVTTIYQMNCLCMQKPVRQEIHGQCYSL